MTTFSFLDVLINPNLVANFDPANDQLDLQATAIEVKVRFGSTTVTFETTAGSVVLPVLATQLVSGGYVDDNLLLNTGRLMFGDNQLATADDSLGNTIFGNTFEGNQYHGLDGDDSYTGGEAPDIVYGNKGADSILGYAGADTLYGGQGDDVILAKSLPDTSTVLIYGNLGTDTLRAGSGNDVIYGGQGMDSVVGLAGDDTIYGNRDDDVILGGAGSDDLYGGQGHDRILDNGSVSSNLIYGNLGNDTITAIDGSNVVYGGQGDDIIYAFGGNGLIKANRGDDAVYVNGSSSYAVYGGPGNDLLDNSLGGAATLYGENRADDGATSSDTLIAGNFGDTVYSGLGDNSVVGGSGADVIIGAGILSGGNGPDDIRAIAAATIDGGGGNDSIDSGVGWNVLIGGAGNDTLVAGNTGFDVMVGGSGNDVFVWDRTGAFGTQAIGPNGSVLVGFDSVQDFSRFSDMLHIDAAAVLRDLNAAVSEVIRLITGLPGTTVITREFVQTANGGQSTVLGGFIGTYLDVTDVKNVLAIQNYSQKSVNATTPLYAFAVNGAATVLWLASVYSSPNNGTYYANVETLKIGQIYASNIVLI